MPLGQFIHLIEKKRLPLVKTILGWEDPCEGILFETILDAFCSYFAENEKVEPALTKKKQKNGPILKSNSYTDLHGQPYLNLMQCGVYILPISKV